MDSTPHKRHTPHDTSARKENFVCLVAHSRKANFVFSNQSSAYGWIVDTGATTHMSLNKEHLSDFLPTAPFKIGMGKDFSVTALSYRDTKFVTLVGSEEIFNNLRRVLYVPDLK